MLLGIQVRIGLLHQHSRESSERERRSQRANPVTGEALSVQPSGHPISISRNSGFEVRAAQEDVGPSRNVTWTGGEERQTTRLRTNSGPNVECMSSQNSVQVAAAPARLSWCLASNFSLPAPTVTPMSYLNQATVGVRQDEESAPEVASADFSR